MCAKGLRVGRPVLTERFCFPLPTEMPRLHLHPAAYYPRSQGASTRVFVPAYFYPLLSVTVVAADAGAWKRPIQAHEVHVRNRC